MSNGTRKLLGTTPAAVGGQIDISEYFSTWLYTGNGSTQTITNGIDLAGEGGLVWTKGRTQAVEHILVDTERGATKYISSDRTNAEATNTSILNSFNADGFSTGNSSFVNVSGQNYASWTFRKAPRFFDVVTYTGNGVAGRQIAHNLGVAPGCIIVKATSIVREWAVYHQSTGATKHLYLNNIDPAVTSSTRWNDTTPTSTEFTVGESGDTNASGATYVAYLFAHDPLGPSGDGSDGLIACGSFTTDGSRNATVDLGWEPQWLLVKAASEASSWEMYDNMRGLGVGSHSYLLANTSGAEGTSTGMFLNSTGFSTSNYWNASQTMIYIAIRRGPMRQPESGTEVFGVSRPVEASGVPMIAGSGVVDTVIHRPRVSTNEPHYLIDRLRGNGRYLQSSSTAAEAFAQWDADSPWWEFDSNNGAINDEPGYYNNFGGYGLPAALYAFKRAPGFFDVVAYTGNDTAGRTVPHNLGVAPELMIVKSRSAVYSWRVYAAPLTANYVLVLDSSGAKILSSASWDNTEPTSDFFTLGSAAATNEVAQTYVAYLFATLPGVSKVGSFVGPSSGTLTVDCGFTSGSRFVLIKCATSSSDWFVYDAARGITVGNDPYLRLNSTAAETTAGDFLYNTSSGFVVEAGSTILGGETYIFLAIA